MSAGIIYYLNDCDGAGRQASTMTDTSLRAQRSNPRTRRGNPLDCFVAPLLAMTAWEQCRRAQDKPE
jgi:hypothetical protein